MEIDSADLGILAPPEEDRSFTVKLKDKSELKLKVVRPTQQQVLKADEIYRIAFAKAVRAEIMTGAEADKYVKKMKLWDKDDDKHVLSLQKEMSDLQKKVDDDKFDNKAEGYLAALSLQQKRDELYGLTRKVSSIHDNTAENASEELKIQNICCMTILKEDGSPFFADFEDFSKRANEQATADALKEAILFHSRIKSNFTMDFPENKWMNKHGFMDDSGNYVQPKLESAKPKKRGRKKKIS